MRRTHQKSRNGCIKCKQKKIKCDEARPSCKYCTTRSLECVYQRSQSTLPPEPRKPASHSNSPIVLTPGSNHRIALTPGVRSPGSRSIVSGHNVNSTFEVPAPSVSSSTPQATPSTPQGQWTTQDLELLHFFSTSTCFTFSRIPEKTHVYQHIAPKIALSHDFLLHGILAMAALHLSKIESARKETLEAYASEHQGIALSLFMPAFSNMNLDNHAACCLYSTLISTYKWAASDGKSNLFFARTIDDSRGDQVEWVQLLRGTGEVIRLYWVELLNGPLAPIIQWDDAVETAAEANPAEYARFKALEKLWDGSHQCYSPTEVNALQETLKALSTTYTMIVRPSMGMDSPSIALAWAVRVPEFYLEMVKRREPAALILLTHFCLVLNRVEDFWWIRGLSRRLLQDIHQKLGKEWDSWIGWPLQDLVLSEFKKDKPES